MLFAISTADVSRAEVAELDTSPPEILKIGTTEVTQTSAKVSWTLDEPATGFVKYGTTKAYGLETTREASFDYTTHVQKLSDLEPGTTYHYAVVSQDAAGNKKVSKDLTFETAQGASAPEPAPDPTPEPKPKLTAALTRAPADTTKPTFLEVSVTELTQATARITWTLDEPAMGRLEYGPTTSYGRKTTKETSFDYTTHVQTIKGLEPGTRYHFRAISEDAAGNWAASDDRTFTTAGAPTPAPTAKPTPEPTPSPDTTSNGIYGPGIAMTSLSNSPIGGPANTNPISLRFRVERSGNLKTARIYVITDRNNTGRTGYSGGNGGRYQISIRPDDGSSANLPGSTELAVETITPGTASNAGYVIRFDPAPRLVAGRLYHMVFKNVDPSPTRNWLSINHSFVHNGGGQRQARWPKSDWAHLRMYRGSWQLRQDHAPILDLGFADGHHQGNGYMEMSYSDSTIGHISGGRQVGERFTMPRDEVATGASVRLQRVSGSAPLEIRLTTASGTTLGQGQVRAADIPLGPSTGLGEQSKWVSTVFDRPVSLKAGQSYRLVLATAGGTAYATWVLREGTYYGYHPATVYTDGSSQQSRDGGSSWSSLGRVPGANDLQFYLATR